MSSSIEDKTPNPPLWILSTGLITLHSTLPESLHSASRTYLDKGTSNAFMNVLLCFQALITVSISYYPWLNGLLLMITPKPAFLVLENIFRDRYECLWPRMRMDADAHSDLVSQICEYNNKSPPAEKL